ncbi:MAG: oligopeptide/dipeptide ABC transporter ATP-binding protein, partial [Candidatus Hydrothermarchaeales archaeon]
GLVGESGSGKTTTGRLITRLENPTNGDVIFYGEDITRISKRKLKPFRKKIQMVFQDPYESLNPRYNVLQALYEPLAVHNIGSKEERQLKIEAVLETVGLHPPREFFNRHPFELSGGQRQRVALARALILDPEFIVADEPISMLDLSVSAIILKLMLKLKDTFDTTYLYITHDLATTRHMCHRIAVMLYGKIIEIGPTEEIIQKSEHPYTRILLSSIPIPDPTRKRKRKTFSEEFGTPKRATVGCRFSMRCSHVQDICKEVEPELITHEEGHHPTACHFAGTLF